MEISLVAQYSPEVFSYRQILLVGKHQEKCITQLILVQHSLELFTSLNDTVTIVAVNDEDDALGVLEIMPPQRSDLVLPTDIPYCELDILVLYSLDIKALPEVSRNPAAISYANKPIVGIVVLLSGISFSTLMSYDR